MLTFDGEPGFPDGEPGVPSGSQEYPSTGRRAFIHYEEVRSTRCRVAPTTAKTQDWRGHPPH